jgi:uncharacterized protein YbjT (DUF2867 family)
VHDSVEELVSNFRHPGDDFAPAEFHNRTSRPNYAGTIRSDRAFYAAGKDATVAFVDLRDVAAVTASALPEKTHTGAVYSLSGGEALSNAKVAERIARLLGTPVA